MDELKKSAANAALSYLPSGGVIGVGTGSTVHYFIEALAQIKNKFDGVVSSSEESTQKLKSKNISVLDLNSVDNVSVYIDGADLIDKHLRMLKGGGGALTREKIITAVAKKFICIADESKYSEYLNSDKIPVSIEVIPMARSYVAREMVKLKATPVYRQGFITDNQNMILDVYQLDLTDPLKTEAYLNNITGVVCHGLFAKKPADVLLLGTRAGVKTMESV